MEADGQEWLPRPLAGASEPGTQMPRQGVRATADGSGVAAEGPRRRRGDGDGDGAGLEPGGAR